MARPALPVGTWGSISRTEISPGKWKARTRFRDFDGKTRDVTAFGSTAAAAERSLREALVARATAAGGSGDITENTFMAQLTAAWLDELTQEERLRPQTLHRYRRIVEHSINPSLGKLRVREVTVGVADRFLKARAKLHPAQAQSEKQVLGQIMNLAERHQAIRYNPVSSVKKLRTVRKEVRALDQEQIELLRTLVRAWRKPTDGPRPSGPRPSGDLPDIVDLLLGTGLRINEVLALRWSDIDLSGDKATLTVNGTLVFITGQGFIRQPVPKSRSGRRTLYLPAFAAGVLLRRRVHGAENELDAVFVSRNGTWLSAHNVRRQLRSALDGTELSWVSTHTFRKTLATIIEREVDSKAAAAQLGHASEAITEGYYIVKSQIAPDLSALIEQRLSPRAAPGA